MSVNSKSQITNKLQITNRRSQIPKYKQTSTHLAKPDLASQDKSQTVGFTRRMGGFTLIEILVSISIIVLISGASLAAFINYLERSQAQSDAQAVANRLRTVQIKATAVEVPAGCTSVSSYAVNMVNSSLTVAADCPGVGSVALADLSLALGNSSFSSNTTVTFSSRSVSASPATIGVCGNNHLFEVIVSEGANVGRPVYAGGC
jgi:prepilin-type N-terminal cleavage/methylation domain-containing protein